MGTSYPYENDRLRDIHQHTIRLKALAMLFGKSAEKLHKKTQRQVCEAEKRISVLQEEMAEVPGGQHDLALPQPLRL